MRLRSDSGMILLHMLLFKFNCRLSGKARAVKDNVTAIIAMNNPSTVYFNFDHDSLLESPYLYLCDKFRTRNVVRLGCPWFDSYLRFGLAEPAAIA